MVKKTDDDEWYTILPHPNFDLEQQLQEDFQTFHSISKILNRKAS